MKSAISAIAILSTMLFGMSAYADDGQKPKLRRHAAVQQSTEAPAPMKKLVCDDPRPECDARPIGGTEPRLEVTYPPSSLHEIFLNPKGSGE